jgi:hypothetical protein
MAATDAQAQTPTSPEIGRWDVAFFGGYLAVRPDLETADRYADRWYASGQVGLIGGWYITRQVKAEVEFSTSSEGRQWIIQQVPIPGASYPAIIGTERISQLREVTGVVAYQFFDNEWVHPFVMLGVAADFERVRTYRPRVTHVIDPRVPAVFSAPEVREGPETTTSARLLFGGGAKFYVTQRVFVRTDGRFGAGEGGSHVAFRLGLGVDF